MHPPNLPFFQSLYDLTFAQEMRLINIVYGYCAALLSSQTGLTIGLTPGLTLGLTIGLTLNLTHTRSGNKKIQLSKNLHILELHFMIAAECSAAGCVHFLANKCGSAVRLEKTKAMEECRVQGSALACSKWIICLERESCHLDSIRI